jgi:hypothetical protein
MLKVPDTPIINEAFKIVKAALNDSIFNHSMRTYLYAYEFAKINKREFSDEELILVALFHDIGFYMPYRIKGKPFQIGSSTALKEYLLSHKKIQPERINAMMEAIDYHLQFKPRWDKGEVAGLLQVGAHMDVMGTKAGSIEKNKRNQILNDYPKNYFFLEFNRCLIKSITNLDTIRGLFQPEKCCGENHYLKPDSLLNGFSV